MRWFYTLTAVILLPAIAFSAVLYVPDDYPTIQQAINASSSGDVIHVRAGTYVENIDYLGKDLAIKSEMGYSVTTIDGSGNGSVVTMTDIPGKPYLAGFAIINGLGEHGGGIFSKNSDPVIENCIITNNRTAEKFFYDGGDGGGIYCDSATIINCKITHNSTADGLFDLDHGGRGGGIYIASGAPRIETCTIAFNTTGNGGEGVYSGSGGSGGGIFAHPLATPSIVGCSVGSNTTGDGGVNATAGSGSAGEGGYGGGIYCENGQIISCTVDNNITGKGTEAKPFHLGFGGDGGSGGGIYCENAYIANCMIIGNETGEGGHGSLSHSDGGYGAGIYFSGGLQSMVNCTVAHNRTGLDSSGAYQSTGGGIFGGSNVVVKNAIVWANTPNQINNLNINLSHSDIQDGTGNPWFDPDTCIDQDPGFVHPEVNYHLTWTSPCINRGTALLAPAEDIDGDARPYMGTVDMGADEFTDLHPMEIDVFKFSVTAGGEIDFRIDAGPDKAGRPYILLGCYSGTVPGYGLPGGMMLPLNWDGLTDLIVKYINSKYFQNFLGILDGNGQAVPKFAAPGMSPVWVGYTWHFSATLGSPFDFVTNPVEIVITE